MPGVERGAEAEEAGVFVAKGVNGADCSLLQSVAELHDAGVF